MHTTNYFDTFIEIAEDCPAQAGEMPPVKGEKKSVANWQFDMLYDHPYKFTSDEIFYTVFARRKEVSSSEWEAAREQFFSKGQPCFRASPLSKRYGWGIHSNSEGKVAMVAAGSDEYTRFVSDESIKKVKAMRNKRVKK